MGSAATESVLSWRGDGGCMALLHLPPSQKSFQKGGQLCSCFADVSFVAGSVLSWGGDGSRRAVLHLPPSQKSFQKGS